MAKIIELQQYKYNKGGNFMSTVAEKNQVTVQVIENLADQILKDNGFFQIPVNPLAIAKLHGIDVINAEFYEEDISGAVTKENDDVTIYINHKDSPNRKKFTIAHELGHVFLHLRNAEGDFIDHNANLYRRTNEGNINDHLEVQANKFAAALLMPSKFVREEWEKTYSVDEMAEKFGVSASSMGFRLQNLRLL